MRLVHCDLRICPLGLWLSPLPLCLRLRPLTQLISSFALGIILSFAWNVAHSCNYLVRKYPIFWLWNLRSLTPFFHFILFLLIFVIRMLIPLDKKVLHRSFFHNCISIPVLTRWFSRSMSCIPNLFNTIQRSLIHTLQRLLSQKWTS